MLRTSDALGYAVIDVETTGLRPSWHRMVEVGIVHLDPAGEITGEWTTLVNPERDLGPRHIHGITAADIRHAPTFGEIAGAVATLLRGRIVNAHNAQDVHVGVGYHVDECHGVVAEFKPLGVVDAG
ncbi:hypothetical protein GCM10023194_46890 [Planotetraspora phitsanulokensis]|uniref:Exonuclease domain-containing protein n=1 Tax=Planotetraspora phitsanulokensis TaxID=575192 RepID=A0A8J3UH66_9ACTN|nr:exonuclease domain-containing protein [Planotetraspora phitsanulokensis]GII43216.1 hypothetical protein Pph01_82190 [Planotetraspora phitsanulokensis]